MFEDKKKQAIIVYRKKEEEYSHLLAGLISAYSEYDVAEWDEKHWLANKATLLSSQKIIFIGDSDEAHKHSSGVSWKFIEHNMKYGWLGNRCIIDTDPLSSTQIQGFCEYYQQKATEYLATQEELDLPRLNQALNKFCDEKNGDSEPSAADSEDPPKAIVRLTEFVAKTYKEQKRNLNKMTVQVSQFVATPKTITNLVRHQYGLLILEFVINGGLRSFMEG